MTRLAAALVGAWVVAVTTVAASDTVGAGALTGGLLLLVALVGLGAARAAAGRRAALGPLERQFGVGVAIAAGQTVFAVVLFAAVMFISAHDALLVCLVVGFSAVVAVAAARMVTGGVLADIRILRDRLAAVRSGHREGGIVTSGHDELAELAEVANATVDRLAVEELARRELVAAISHDLRTPLTSLRLLADALGDDVVAEEDRWSYIERIRGQITTLSALIDDLFELSRLESGEIAWSMQQVHLAMLVDDTVEVMRAHAEAKGVAIHCDVPADLPPAHGNPEKLQRVLFNLLQNAIRHTPEDGSVRVLAEPAERTVEVEIADDGAGIADQDRARVFQAFFQGGERAARGGDGAGLGLAIARAIVEAHGGRIWLEEARAGARVRFSLPAAA